MLIGTSLWSALPRHTCRRSINFPKIAEEGGFAAYGPRLRQLFGEINSQQIVQLFRGTKVADIPVEQATKFELVINLKTANAMGVTVPPLCWRELTR